MNKPSGYDEARVSGEFVQPELGGHYCKIVQVSETKSKNGKDQIVVLFDFSPEDKQPGLFKSMFDNDTKTGSEKKWPFAGSKWIMVNDYQDSSKTSSQFKTFCNCIEKSNNCEIEWGGSNWAQQFKGKKIGAVYGEEENEYNGRTFMRNALRWFCQIDAVKDAKIPNPRYLDPDKARRNTHVSNDFMNIPDDVEEQIPF